MRDGTPEEWREFRRRATRPCHDGQMDDPFGALRAWLLAEDAYERGGVPDEVLTYLQDHVDDLLGSHATLVAGEFLRSHAGAGHGIAELARDPAALRGLLAVIEGGPRAEPELEWRAERPAPD